MKETLKDILRIVGICVILLSFYVMIDILNVPSGLGLPMQCINWDAASLVCGNLVVIALFALTYRALDKRSIQKEHNQRKVAVYMLRGTLMACTSQIQMLKDPRVMETILKKVDFNKTADNDATYNKLLTAPFTDHESIVSFASEGVLSEEEFSDYNGVRTYYHLMITCLITFHDLDALKVKAEAKFNEAISKAEATIKRGKPV